MINVRHQGNEQYIDFTLPGGMLSLVTSYGSVQDELLPGEPAQAMTLRREFRYNGVLPKEMAIQLAGTDPSAAGVTVDGKPFLEWLESL